MLRFLLCDTIFRYVWMCLRIILCFHNNKMRNWYYSEDTESFPCWKHPHVTLGHLGTGSIHNPMWGRLKSSVKNNGLKSDPWGIPEITNGQKVLHSLWTEAVCYFSCSRVLTSCNVITHTIRWCKRTSVRLNNCASINLISLINTINEDVHVYAISTDKDKPTTHR